MPFSDLKKFWEAHFGGRSVQTEAKVEKSNQNNFSINEGVISGDCKSVQSQTPALIRAVDDLEMSAKHTTGIRPSSHHSFFQTIGRPCTDAKRSGVEYSKKSSRSYSRENNCNHGLLNNSEKDNMYVCTTPCATKPSKNMDEITKELHDTLKPQQSYQSENLSKLLKNNICVATKDVLPEVSSSPERKIASCERKDFRPLFKSLEYSEHNQSDSRLNNIVENQREPKSKLTFVDTSSAPASIHSSPLRSMKVDMKTQLHLKSIVKFNELHNFWKMREKKPVRQSIQERRCLHCGCYLNNCYYEQDGALYCEEHYWNKYGHSCKKCETIVTGPVMIAGLFRFHPECFQCKCCKRCISDGDSYALVLFDQGSYMSTSTLFCSTCYQGLLSESRPNEITGEMFFQSCQCTVITVLDLYLMNRMINNELDTKQVRKTGYGITVKDPPVVLPSAEGFNRQPTGQIVCGIENKEECSLHVGDILLQVNGLTVDLNALDLIERLFDDTDTPLQVTIQRELKAPVELYLCQQSPCAHWLPQQSPSKTIPNQDDCKLKTPTVAYQAPKCPETLFTDVKTVMDRPGEDLLAFASSDKDNDRSCCRASLEDNNADCNFHLPFRFTIGDEAIVMPQEGAVSNSKFNSDEAMCKSEIMTNTKVNGCSFTSELDIDDEVINKKTTPSNESSNFIKCSNEMRNAPSIDVCGTEIEPTLNAHVLTQDADDPTFEGKTVSISQQQIPLECLDESTNSAICIDGLSSQAEVIVKLESSETDITETDNISQVALTKLLLNAVKSDLSLGGGKTPKNSQFEMNEGLPKVPPRTKRRKAKRKSLRRILPPTIELPIEVVETPKFKSATLKCRRNVTRTVPARRSSSLRNDVPYVNSRQTSPRSRINSPESTLSVHSAQGMHICSDLNRSESMRICGSQLDDSQRVFRPCDLIHGEVLGQGFFGKAIKVTHRDTGEVMVLKVLNSLDVEVEKSFLKEVKVMRNLSHRNVIHFIGVLYKDKHLNIITEFVECGTLRDVLSNMDEDLSWQQRICIARDISTGMSYLHSRSIIHRDLNSGNCFVKDDGTVVVADFGLARIQPKNGTLGRKKRYTVVGNPYWMAPEMLYGNMYDERVDVFSFGIVLCEIIGRVEADPDYIPRSSDFGLAVSAFHAKLCKTCPAYFFAIAVHASNLLPDNRPSFQELEEWFEMLAIREELSRLPEPPNLHEIIVSVYTKHNIPLPLNLYCDPTDQDVVYPPVPMRDVYQSQTSPLICAKSS